MAFENLWHNVVAGFAAIPRSELLIISICAMCAGLIGSAMVRGKVPLGRFVRAASTLVLLGVLITIVLQLSRFDPRLSVALPHVGLPEQVVEGNETRIQLSDDGHFWIRAQLNGVPANFLVDTGATVTAISQSLADAAGLAPRRGGLPVTIGTANGVVNVKLASIDELRFGNIAARGLDVVIAPTLGETNVLGMNFLSRLAAWRVEGRTMILTPHHPQEPLELR